MTQEALKLALEALEANDQLINGTGTNGGLVYCMDGYYSDCFDVDPINKQTEEAIAAIKEALAQPERPAPCAKHCEATAFQITIKNLEVQLAQLKPLTDEDIKKLWVSNRAAIPRYLCFARAIEAKLKEKNFV